MIIVLEVTIVVEAILLVLVIKVYIPAIYEIVEGTLKMSTLDCTNRTCTVSVSDQSVAIIIIIMLCAYLRNLGSVSAYQLQYSSTWRSSITLVCRTRYSPPSSIKWYRDNVLLGLNDSTTDMSVRVTHRGYYGISSTSFDITLSICAPPDDIVGRYTCEVGNRLGRSSRSYQVRGKCCFRRVS